MINGGDFEVGLEYNYNLGEFFEDFINKYEEIRYRENKLRTKNFKAQRMME